MDYRRSLIDILDDVVASITTNITIFKVDSDSEVIETEDDEKIEVDGDDDETAEVETDNGGPNYIMQVDDVAYATVGYKVNIGGKDYKILAVDDTPCKSTITVRDINNSGPPPVTNFSLYPLFFFHGTPKATDSEIILKLDANEKYPMVWLWEEYQETFEDNRVLELERTAPVRLFFLQKGKSDKLMTDMLTEKYVKPMEKLRDLFIDQVNIRRDIFERSKMQFTCTPKTRFGVFLQGKGVEKQLFADDLSGIEMAITLKIRKPPKNCC